jgi:hypothetical protein
MKFKLPYLMGLLALAPLGSQAAMTKMDTAELSNTTGQLHLNLGKLVDLGMAGKRIVLPAQAANTLPPGQNPLYPSAPGQSPLFQFDVHHKIFD